jgi:excisionase family DNA binding protein
MTTSTLDPVILPQSQEEQVVELHKLLEKEGRAQLVGKGGEPSIKLPDAIYHLLLEILALMRQGKAISIRPYTQELTTQQAADLLCVSRPYLVKLLEEGAIRFHKTGTHRRIYLRDLVEYKSLRDESRHTSIERMARAAQEAGLYDKVLLPED